MFFFLVSITAGLLKVCSWLTLMSFIDRELTFDSNRFYVELVEKFRKITVPCNLTVIVLTNAKMGIT